MANPKSKSKPEPKFRPVIEQLADFNFAGNPSSLAHFRTSGTIKSLAVTTLPADPLQSFIYIGSSAGVIFVFSLNPAAAPDHRLSLLKHAVITNGSPLISILVVGTLGKIIALAGDGFLYLLDSLLVEPAKKISVIKGGVTVVARRFFSKINDYSNHERNMAQSNGSIGSSSFFVAATIKKLVFMELNSNGTVVIVKEILGAFEGPIMDMVWVDDSVIFGTTRGYFLKSCVSGQCRLLFFFPELSRPQLKLFFRECRVLLVVDTMVAVTVDTDGQPVGGSLVFKGFPDSIAEIGSYVVVAESGKVDVYHKKSGNRMQLVMLPADASGDSHFVADQEDGNGELVVVSTSSKV